MSFTDVGAFPCEGYGIEDGECFPVFQSKKVSDPPYNYNIHRLRWN